MAVCIIPAAANTEDDGGGEWEKNQERNVRKKYQRLRESVFGLPRGERDEIAHPTSSLTLEITYFSHKTEREETGKNDMMETSRRGTEKEEGVNGAQKHNNRRRKRERRREKDMYEREGGRKAG